MDLAVVQGLQVLYGITGLLLISLGLAVIFGMMRIINLAHGEFMMLGGYTTVVASGTGINLWVSMLFLAPLLAGLVGLLAERTLLRYLYGRRLDSLLATWGLSLLLIGLVATFSKGRAFSVAGPPLGPVSVGNHATGGYELFLAFFTIALLAVVYWVLRHTRLGLVARASMQDPAAAALQGVGTPRVHASTFTLGCALSGLAGGLLAPLTGVLPTIGAAYVAKAFVVVISGGQAIIAGTLSASVLLGMVQDLVTFLAGPTLGETALLLAAIILLRVLPEGITSRFFRTSP